MPAHQQFSAADLDAPRPGVPQGVCTYGLDARDAGCTSDLGGRDRGTKDAALQPPVRILRHLLEGRDVDAECPR